MKPLPSPSEMIPLRKHIGIVSIHSQVRKMVSPIMYVTDLPTPTYFPVLSLTCSPLSTLIETWLSQDFGVGVSVFFSPFRFSKWSAVVRLSNETAFSKGLVSSRL